MTEPLLSIEERRYTEALQAWRERRGMTKKALAERIPVDPSRVGHIEAGRQRPTEDFTRQVEAVLLTGGELPACWEAIENQRFGTQPRAPERDLSTVEFISWLADHSHRDFAEIYQAVSAQAARIEAEAHSTRYARTHARGQVTQAQITEALVAYYGANGFVRARTRGADLRLSIVTEQRWLNAVELGGATEAFQFMPQIPSAYQLDPATTAAAIDRIASVETNSTVMINNPLYRLLQTDIDSNRLMATFSTVPFAEYSLVCDILGDELVDAVAARDTALPLRDIHLPDKATAFAIDRRVCVGGMGALVAVARRRPASGQSDYLLFVQERSGKVLNLPGSLAVIPKAFHQPVNDVAGEVRLSSTLRRELEEELLGRQDLEQLGMEGIRSVDPMHDRHVTEPMAWLMGHPDAYRTECLGFGFNMVTGNYDFPCLVVVDDPEWWDRFGHVVEANWEAQQVQRFSTLDTAGLAALISQPHWCNEGLFALLLGLRRLSEVGDPARVAVPEIELEIL